MKASRAVILLVAVVALAGAAGLFLLRDPGRSPAATAVAPGASDWISSLANAPVDGLGRPASPWTLALPQDHAPHPGARTEAWQISLHLSNDTGDPVGVQFSLFRIGLAGPDAPPAASPWEPRELFRGHATILDGARGKVFSEERLGRGMAGLAGYDPVSQELRMDNWSVGFNAGPEAGGLTLRITAGDARADLNLTTITPPLIVDADGAPFHGYAFSRLKAEGTLETPEARQAVGGVAWFDHVWGELPLPGGSPVASDRLQLHLDDGSGLSVVRSRRLDGRGTPTVEALIIHPDGGVSQIEDSAARIDIPRLWQGTAAEWPVDWNLYLGDLVLSVTAVADDQEHAFLAPAWIGLVRAEGLRGERTVTGIGTLQLTGYARP